MRHDTAVSITGGGPTIGTNEHAQMLEQLLSQKGGQLINETLQPPTYMRSRTHE